MSIRSMRKILCKWRYSSVYETQPNDLIRSGCAGATHLEELYTLMVTSLANVLSVLGQVQHGLLHIEEHARMKRNYAYYSYHVVFGIRSYFHVAMSRQL